MGDAILYSGPNHVVLTIRNKDWWSGTTIDIYDLEGDDDIVLSEILRRVYRGFKEHQQVLPEDGFEETGWLRVVSPDGKTWCETSDEIEARERMRPGDVLQKKYTKTKTEWRTIS